jgi:hypothetical protein
MKESTDDNHGEIILYQTPDNQTALEVRFEEETVWLTQAQMVDLFGRDRTVITKHINNIFKENELTKKSNVHFLHSAISDKPVKLYSLDVIISVGYRVKSQRGTQFRIWANGILKSYLLKGYAIREQFEHIEKKLHQHDKTLFEHEQKFDLIIKTTLPPHEGIFYDGQIFDAYKFVSDIIKSAQKSIVLIDNYADESTLLLLSKREKGVDATIYTYTITKQLQHDIKVHSTQYESIAVKTFSKSHDRFLIIDKKTVYHVGASLKDLGKKWFAFSKIELNALEMLDKLNEK